MVLRVLRQVDALEGTKPSFAQVISEFPILQKNKNKALGRIRALIVWWNAMREYGQLHKPQR